MRHLTTWLAIAALLISPAMASSGLTRYVTQRAHPSLPSPLRFLPDAPQVNLNTIATPGVLVRGYVMWLPGCFFTGVAFTSLLRQRELRLDEAYEILGSCVVPVLGGLAMRKLFELHPEWKRLPLPPRWTVDFSIRSQS